MSFNRPTTLSAALVQALVALSKAEMIDPATGKGNWIARRVALNCERPGFGVKHERDNRPVKKHR